MLAARIRPTAVPLHELLYAMADTSAQKMQQMREASQDALLAVRALLEQTEADLKLRGASELLLDSTNEESSLRTGSGLQWVDGLCWGCGMHYCV